MADSYTIESFTTKENKVDIYDAAHMNAVQTSIVNLQTALNRLIQDNGAIRKATSFPGSPVAGEWIFRSDLDTVYYRNAANSAWIAFSGSLSNVVFQYLGVDHPQTNAGAVNGASTRDTNAAGISGYNYIGLIVGGGVSTDTYYNLLNGKFTKISSINTITVRFRAWGSGSGANRDVTVRGTIGSATGNGSVNSAYTSPAWGSFTIDVSALVNGTTYDVTVEMKFGTSEVSCGMDSLIMIAS